MADADRTPRTWLAVVLAFIMPGAGHLYLRSWIRALLWFGLFYTTFILIVPAPAQEAELSVEGLMAMARAVPLGAQVAVVGITLLNMADAYWLSSRANARASTDGTAACPNCGKELDEDIDFCHWCTTKLEEPTAEDESAA